MILRDIQKNLLRLSTQYPVVTITGPRQSGKTTLCKFSFPDKPYLSLENPDIRFEAKQDPNGFLSQFPNGAILDEIQRVPELLSYIQTKVDTLGKEGLFILTGSQQFELMQAITQSLAGRTALLTLLPLSISEAYPTAEPSLNQILFTGFYPRIFDKNLNPTEALSFYISTYIDRDVRQLLKVKDLTKFEVFIKLCASQTGQVFNLTALGNDCGVSHNTIKEWVSVLEASYIITLIQPYYKNFRKRLIKAPRLHFLDTGLAAYLLGIKTPEQLQVHPLRGALFESLVTSELLKIHYNHVQKPALFYFRDSSGHEVDLIWEQGLKTIPIEIKSSQTIASDATKNLNFYSRLSGSEISLLVYSGDRNYSLNQVQVLRYSTLKAWFMLNNHF